MHSPKDAAELGIATVYQDLALCDNLDIVQNMFLGRERLRHLQLDEVAMETVRQEHAGRPVGGDGPLDQAAGRSLSGGQRQAVAVAKAVMRKPSS